MREQLQAIIASGKPWAVERAQMALAMTEALERGELAEQSIKNSCRISYAVMY
jgi:hypothetical protein